MMRALFPSPFETVAGHLARNPQQIERLVRSKWMIWRNLRQARRLALPSPVFVSITSRPARFAALANTLKSLLMQSTAPRAVVLWIADGDAPLLPHDVLELQSYGLQIRPCRDGRTCRNLIPGIEQQPNAFWATAQDDCYYPPTWLASLVRAWAPYSREVICHRGHRIRVDAAGVPLPSAAWQRELRRESVHPGNIMAPSGGVLYPPGCFPREVSDDALCHELCPDAEEAWLWWMLRRHDYWVRKVGGPFVPVRWVDAAAVAPAASRPRAAAIDDAMRRMVAHFGFPGQNAARGPAE